MKRCLALVLALLTLASGMSALAETVLVNQPDRKIEVQGRQADGAFMTNITLPGESPTTGRDWEGEYMPMLVQIDNDGAGIGIRAPWGAAKADIVYETPLHKNGSTRISFLFSDEMPDGVGPVRSARVGHVWLWYEWLGGFVYYGGQEADSANINKEFSKLGYKYYEGPPLYCGTVGANKKWKKYFTAVKGLASPHNMNADLEGMLSLMPEEHEAKWRPFLFTDEAPQGGEEAHEITVGWKHKDYVCSFTYDEAAQTYARFVTGEPYVDKDTGEQLTFANVIIQRTEVEFPGVAIPIMENVSQGNADIFMGGRYIAGYWVRTSLEDRTVFFDAQGNELELQRGKTYIAMADSDIPVTYSAP